MTAHAFPLEPPMLGATTEIIPLRLQTELLRDIEVRKANALPIPRQHRAIRRRETFKRCKVRYVGEQEHRGPLALGYFIDRSHQAAHARLADRHPWNEGVGDAVVPRISIVAGQRTG